MSVSKIVRLLSFVSPTVWTTLFAEPQSMRSCTNVLLPLNLYVKGHTVSELRPNFTSLTFPLSIKRLFYVGKGLKMRPMTLRPLLGCKWKNASRIQQGTCSWPNKHPWLSGQWPWMVKVVGSNPTRPPKLFTFTTSVFSYRYSQ